LGAYYNTDENSLIINVDRWTINLSFANGRVVSKNLFLVTDFVDFDGNNATKMQPPPKDNPATKPPEPTRRPPETAGNPLSKIRPETAKVGSGRAYAATLYSFRQTFHNSLNAHAPSHYVFPLNREWKTLKTHYGLRNHTNLNEANCIFIVNGDGRELFRSGEIRDNREHVLELNVSGVDKLELIVESKGNKDSDRAAWFTPILSR